MNVHTEIAGDQITLSIVLKSRDDLEKAIPWLPTLRVLFPYPAPPLPDNHSSLGKGSAHE